MAHDHIQRPTQEPNPDRVILGVGFALSLVLLLALYASVLIGVAALFS